MIGYFNCINVFKNKKKIEMSEKLLQAWALAQFNDLDSLATLVPSEVDPNESTASEENHMHTLLMCAASHGALDCANYLIDNGAIVDKKNFMGYTALHWTAFTGRIEVVDLLLKKGANINARTEDGRTILHVAASRGHLQYITYIMDLLEKNKANDNTEDEGENDDSKPKGLGMTFEEMLNSASSSGWNALFFAIAGNQKRVAQYLVDKGIETNTPDINLKTQSDIAQQVNCSWFNEVVKDLIERDEEEEEHSINDFEEDEDEKSQKKSSAQKKDNSKSSKSPSKSESENEQSSQKSKSKNSPSKPK